MFFLFEFAFFLVAIITVALVEAAGREPAVLFGLSVTVLSLVSRQIVAARVPLPAGHDRAALRAASEKARWWRATLDSWWHLNRALLIGSAALLLWAGLARWLVS